MGNPTNLERLRVEIALKRAALYEHRAELFRLQADLESFSREYEQVVGRVEAEIGLVQAELDAEYRRRQFRGNIHYNQTDSGLGEFSSFAEYFASRHTPPSEQPAAPAEVDELMDAEDLRAVYRRLARKFHPDTVTNPEEKQRLSATMAEINAAYRRKDLSALRRLERQDPEQVRREAPAETIREPEYMASDELRALAIKLDEEILWTRNEYNALINSALMRLRIECRMQRGRDPLAEIAAQKRADLVRLRAELAAVRARKPL